MDIFPFHEFRQQRMFVLEHDGAEAFQLGFLFPEDVNLVSAFQAAPDIGRQEFKILVEYWLGSYIKGYRRNISSQRNIQEHVRIFQQRGKEIPVFIHIGRI